MAISLIGLNTEELRALAQQEAEPAYRGDQIAEWLYQRRVRMFDEMTNLPQSLRQRLSRKYELGRSQVVTTKWSRDGTMKLLLAMPDGATLETVGIPYADRFSCCVSTQVGCAIGCVFCASGLGGYIRNLTAGEIVDQVLTVEEEAAKDRSRVNGSFRRIDHVTFMGMGEPLLNYASTLKAIQLFNAELGIAMRHLTVSTAGIVPGIMRLAQEKLQLNLAVSLHAATDDLRRRLTPRLIKWNISEIIEACRHYIHQTGRRVTFEYCLLNGVNDSIAEALELARILRGLNCHVNLIPYNPVGGLAFRATPRKQALSFRKVLERASIPVTQRMQRGADIDAACGQLRRQTMATATKQSPSLHNRG